MILHFLGLRFMLFCWAHREMQLMSFCRDEPLVCSLSRSKLCLSTLIAAATTTTLFLPNSIKLWLTKYINKNREEFGAPKITIGAREKAILRWFIYSYLGQIPQLISSSTTVYVAFLLKGDVERGRRSILEGIKIREELGVQLYVAAGNCDLGREKLNNRLTRLYKYQLLYLLVQATRLLLSYSIAALIRVNMVISRIIDRESQVSAVRLHRGKKGQESKNVVSHIPYLFSIA